PFGAGVEGDACFRGGGHEFCKLGGAGGLPAQKYCPFWARHPFYHESDYWLERTRACVQLFGLSSSQSPDRLDELPEQSLREGHMVEGARDDVDRSFARHQAAHACGYRDQIAEAQ